MWEKNGFTIEWKKQNTRKNLHKRKKSGPEMCVPRARARRPLIQSYSCCANKTKEWLNVYYIGVFHFAFDFYAYKTGGSVRAEGVCTRSAINHVKEGNETRREECRARLWDVRFDLGRHHRLIIITALNVFLLIYLYRYIRFVLALWTIDTCPRRIPGPANMHGKSVRTGGQYSTGKRNPTREYYRSTQVCINFHSVSHTYGFLDRSIGCHRRCLLLHYTIPIVVVYGHAWCSHAESRAIASVQRAPYDFLCLEILSLSFLLFFHGISTYIINTTHARSMRDKTCDTFSWNND